MVEYIISKGKPLSKDIPDNIYSAMADQLVLHEQTGCRRNELTQDHAYLKKHQDIQRNVDGSPVAFIMKYFEFRRVKKATINNIKWHFQKILDNGQVLSYIEDPKNKLYCAVSASKRIYKRAKN